MPVEPKRIQQKRSKGWRLPPNARSVARPSKYGNPFVVKPCDSGCCWTIDDPCGIAFRREEPNNYSTKEAARKAAVDLYELHTGPIGAYEFDDVDELRRELRGKDLACWCPLPAEGEADHCHARILLEIANAAEVSG